jgi:hypothetical protein
MKAKEKKEVLEEMVTAQKQEVENSVRRWVEEKEKDLGELEVRVREWALGMGLVVLGRLMEGIAKGIEERKVRCPGCEGAMGSEGRRSVKIHTSMGSIEIERKYWVCERCPQGMALLDRELKLDEQHNSPTLQRMVSLAGSVAPFEKASELLWEIGTITMSGQTVEGMTEQVGERVEGWMKRRQQEAVLGIGRPEGVTPRRLYVEADGTTVPMKAERCSGEEEAQSRRSQGQRTPGKVEYKEVKLGAIFDATVDENGKPQIGEKTYTGTFEDAEACVRQVKAEAKARGSEGAEEIVLLSDGGGWLWNRLPEAFEGKKQTQILDWCHPSERLGRMAKLVFGEATPEAVKWADRLRGLQYEGHTTQVLEEIEALRPKTPEAKEFLRQSVGYFREHAHRMNYGELRAQGYFIGSGVIESACKHIAGDRLKRAGMKWSRQHVPKLLALRVCRASNWWSRFWTDSARSAAS